MLFKQLIKYRITYGRILKTLGLSWLLIFAKLGLAASLNDISITPVAKSNNQKIELKLTLSGSAAYKVFALSQPNRLVIDLNNTTLNKHLNLSKIAQSPVSQIRPGKPDAQTLRLVVDLKKSLHLDSVALHRVDHGEELILQLKPKTHTLDEDNQTPAIASTAANMNDNKSGALAKAQDWVTASLDENSNTKVRSQHSESKKHLNDDETATNNNENPEDAANQLTLTAPEKSSIAMQARAASTPKLVQITATPLVRTSAANATIISKDEDDTSQLSNSRRPIIVVIDPGHGGKDPGTIGAHATQEKDVVLAISKNLQETINKQPGFRAVLTRSRDYFIPLRQRLQIARQDKADIFVAIHADAYQDPYATGASVFALSQHGASSEAARWLAEKENYSELGGVTLTDKSDVLRSVLIDLSQTATIASGVQIGSSILQQIGKIGPLHHGYVEQAPFMVLKNPDIPSLLVETGFLSNPQEEARLRNADYQQKLANAICTGIRTYFAGSPPPGTLLAALKTKGSNRDV